MYSVSESCGEPRKSHERHFITIQIIFCLRNATEVPRVDVFLKWCRHLVMSAATALCALAIYMYIDAYSFTRKAGFSA